jgi:Arm DNA-binding domain
MKRREIPDAGKPGLYLVVQPKPSGKKSWAVRYRHRGQPRKLTLYGFPSLKEAHRLAQLELDKVANGRDPAAEKKEAKRTKLRAADATEDLFPNVSLRFIQRYVRPKNLSWAETARLLGLRQDKETGEMVTVRGGLADKWAKRRVQEIRKRDVLDLLNEIVDRPAPVLANRTLAALRKLFNWCKSQDILAHEAVSPGAFVEPRQPSDRVTAF